MKKKVFVLALLVASAGNASAQKWLKSIGKVLDKAEQVLQPETKKAKTGNQQATSDNKQRQSNKADYTLTEVLQVNNTVVATPVDLGLSVKWASKNLGAAQPFQYGGYYDRTAEYLSNYWGGDGKRIRRTLHKMQSEVCGCRAGRERVYARRCRISADNGA